MRQAQIKQENIFKIFGNNERVRLLCCLEKPHSVTELLEKCTLSQSALSQHLKLLREEDFVRCIRVGKSQVYSVNNKDALAFAKKILQFIAQTT